MKRRMPIRVAVMMIAAVALVAPVGAMAADKASAAPLGSAAAGKGSAAPLGSAAGGKAFANSPCFSQKGPAASQGCEQLARQVSHDIETVRRLGDQLEDERRYDDAVSAYQTALAVHPNHRDLLQRLIRARSQVRSMRLLSPPEARQPATADAAQKPAGAQPQFSQASASQAQVPQASPSQAQVPQASPSQAQVPPAQPAAGNASAAPVAGSTAASLPRSRSPLSRQLPAAAPPESTPAAAAAAPSPSPPTVPGDGRYLALVIGNEQYKDFERLRTPLADARAIADVLTRDYGFKVTTLANATRYQIVSALSRLRQEATERDNVLIYYAGHGYLDDTTSRGYWLPVDAEHDNLANWLSTSDITDLLAGLQAKHALILADSCFSGTLLRSAINVSIDERQSLLHKLSTRRSRSIMTSGGLEPVVDNGGGRHSVFAAAVLDALRDNRQQLEAARLFMQIRDRVALNAAQTPQYGPLRNAGHEGGDFIFERTGTQRR